MVEVEQYLMETEYQVGQMQRSGVETVRNHG